MAGQLATFTIETFDAATGARRHEPADKFVVLLSGAATVRARVYAEGDGRYTCEYKCPSSGKYRLSVMNHSRHLSGSPFVINVKSGGSLKEWKAKQAKEASELRERKKERERERSAPAQKRAPSPRINPAEQLAKAYELALAGIAANRANKAAAAQARVSSRGGTAAGGSSAVVTRGGLATQHATGKLEALAV